MAAMDNGEKRKPQFPQFQKKLSKDLQEKPFLLMLRSRTT